MFSDLCFPDIFRIPLSIVSAKGEDPPAEGLFLCLCVLSHRRMTVLGLTER